MEVQSLLRNESIKTLGLMCQLQFREFFCQKGLQIRLGLL